MTSASREPGSPGHRPLGSFERAQLLTSESSPFNLVVSLRVEGPLDRERLRRALDRLQRAHPTLALRLIGKSAAATFAGGAAPMPLRLRARSRETSWVEAVETELATGFDHATGPLARCCLLEPGTPGAPSEIILAFHHMIVDGAAAGRIVDDLLELCGGEGERPASAPGTPPAPTPRADDLFPGRYRGVSGIWPSCRFLGREMAGEIVYRWRTRTHRARPRPTTLSGEPARCRILPVAFSAADTETLVRATRRLGLTLNSALNAALLLAVVRRRYPGTDLPHRYFVFPTLRPYLDPPVPEDRDGSYATVVRLTVRAAETRDVWDLAAEIQGQIQGADQRGVRFLATRFSAMMMKTILGQSGRRMGTTGMSYTGAYPFRLEHGGLTLTEVHGFVSNLPVGAEYTAQARIFRGRLWLDLLYLDADMGADEARAIADETCRILMAGSLSVTGAAAHESGDGRR